MLMTRKYKIKFEAVTQKEVSSTITNKIFKTTAILVNFC